MKKVFLIAAVFSCLTAAAQEEAVMGFPIKGNEDRFAALNATTYIDANDVPVAVFHGNADNVVPGCVGVWFYECLQKAGVDSELTVVEGGGHGMNMYSAENLSKMVKFLDRVRTAGTGVSYLAQSPLYHGSASFQIKSCSKQ